MLMFHRPIAYTAALAVLLGTTALAVPVFAADSDSMNMPASPTTSDATQPKTHHHHAKEDPAERMKQHVEIRIKTLHDELKVTKEQDAQWETVAQAMRDSEANMAKLVETRKANKGTMSAIDDVKSYQAIAQAHADGLAKFIAAFEPFYNSLNDAQKKTADSFFGKSQKHGRRHHDHEAAPADTSK